MDKAKKSNLENLVKIGENLLKSNVMRMNLETDLYESIKESVTNDQELKR